jgi:hypothetical protein
LKFLEIAIEVVEALLPEAAVALDPIGNVPEWCRLEPERSGVIRPLLAA